MNSDNGVSLFKLIWINIYCGTRYYLGISNYNKQVKKDCKRRGSFE